MVVLRSKPRYVAEPALKSVETPRCETLYEGPQCACSLPSNVLAGSVGSLLVSRLEGRLRTGHDRQREHAGDERIGLVRFVDVRLQHGLRGETVAYRKFQIV